MMDVFMAGGFFMWPIAAAAVLVLGLAATAATRLTRDGADPGPELRSRIDAILFWGGFAAVLGVLGTTGGIAQMARAIEVAGGASAALVWGGVQLALVTTLFGLAVLIVSLLLWYALSLAAGGRMSAAA